MPTQKILVLKGGSLKHVYQQALGCRWRERFLLTSIWMIHDLGGQDWYRFKLNIQETKIMASGPITSWQIDGETVETVSDFILGGSKITADVDSSREIKRCLLLGRISYAQPR